MEVLAAYSQHGWSQVWTLPNDPAAVPDTSAIPGASPAPAQAVSYKGPAVSWPDWASRLARRAPYHGWFRVEEVPAASAHDALSWLRAHDGLLG